MKQCASPLTNLLTESRLKEKEGTKRTLVRIKEAEIRTVPICVTIAKCVFGKRTCLETTDEIEVKK
jgi:hypothetical protein